MLIISVLHISDYKNSHTNFEHTKRMQRLIQHSIRTGYITNSSSTRCFHTAAVSFGSKRPRAVVKKKQSSSTTTQQQSSSSPPQIIETAIPMTHDDTITEEADFITQAAVKDRKFAALAHKPLEQMTSKQRAAAKQELERKFLQSVREKLTRDSPEDATQITDKEILDFAHAASQGLYKRVRVPDSNVPADELQRQTNLQKEIDQMTIEEKNSVYTFTLYRIMLGLLRGKKLNRGESTTASVDVPMTSKSEQEALRKEIKKQFLATAGVRDPVEIQKCFTRAEHAIYRFNATILGNISLPPRSRSDMDKYDRIEKNASNTTPVEAYWNAYYMQEGSLDEWYCNFDTLKHLFQKVVTENENVPFQNTLVIGCGMSSLGSELLTSDFAQKVTQIDISQFAVLHMKDVYKSILRKQAQLLKELKSEDVDKLKLLEFKHVDAREMSEEFSDDTFDCVVDKACLDSILTTSDTGEDDIPLIETEVWRVLKPDTGIWLLVTVLDRDGINDLLVNCTWKVECVGSHEFIANTFLHMYKLTKITTEAAEEEDNGE
jgi:hypothetical protein